MWNALTIFLIHIPLFLLSITFYVCLFVSVCTSILFVKNGKLGLHLLLQNTVILFVITNVSVNISKLSTKLSFLLSVFLSFQLRLMGELAHQEDQIYNLECEYNEACTAYTHATGYGLLKGWSDHKQGQATKRLMQLETFPKETRNLGEPLERKYSWISCIYCCTIKSLCALSLFICWKHFLCWRFCKLILTDIVCVCLST